MSKYEISNYSFNKAKKINVSIKPSTNPKKKIDVFDNGIKVASIGDIRYLDYPSYVKNFGSRIANLRRNAYHKRHAHEPKKRPNGQYSPSFYADFILW